MFSDWRVTQRRCQGPPASLALSPSFSFNHDAYACDILWGGKNLDLITWPVIFICGHLTVMITIVCLTFNVFLTEDY